MTERNYQTDNKSFMIYKEWKDIVTMLSKEQAGALFMALFEFASGGEVEELDGMTAMAFKVISTSIERDGHKWEATCKRRSESVNKRWNKNTSDTEEYNCIQDDTNDTDKDKEKDKEKDKDKDKEKEEEKDKDKEKDTDYTTVSLSQNEMDILVGLADGLIIENYISKIREWQVKNKKLNTQPYASIRKWLDEDGVKQNYHPKDRRYDYKYDYLGEKELEAKEFARAYDEFARSIDFDKIKL